MTLRFKTIVFLILWIASYATSAQSLTDEVKKSTIGTLCTRLNENYVFPAIAAEAAKHLERKLAEGTFNEITEGPAFAKALTRELQTITHDKHLRVRVNSGDRQSGLNRDTWNGFQESKVLDHNMGYLDVRGFSSMDLGSAAADEHMKHLENVDALILDLRKNGGGNPAMVQYLCSYFFGQRVHLNSIYDRVKNTTTEYWTIPVQGKKLPDIPLFVLTSGFTFSGGEECAYNMQTQQRATLIGETTGGGANPGAQITINETFAAFIPTGRAVNPITGTNWEGTGVVPEVRTTADQALTKAIELATPAAASFQKKRAIKR